MMSTSWTKSSSTARGSKAKPTKPVVLRLSPTSLSRFPHEKAAVIEISKASTSSSPTPTPSNNESPTEPDVKTEPKTEAANASSNSLSVPVDGRKRGGGSKAGTKRSLSAIVDGQPKPRGKPGPKKRKLDGVPNGDENGRPWTTPAPTAGHKLGPKANQGAINAGLRALDRSGKPCRKWSKKGFSVKSFTGIMWSLPSWGAPKRQTDIKGEPGQSDTPTSNSEANQPQGSSNVGSETSRNNVNDVPEATASPSVVAATA